MHNLDKLKEAAKVLQPPIQGIGFEKLDNSDVVTVEQYNELFDAYKKQRTEFLNNKDSSAMKYYYSNTISALIKDIKAFDEILSIKHLLSLLDKLQENQSSTENKMIVLSVRTFIENILENFSNCIESEKTLLNI